MQGINQEQSGEWERLLDGEGNLELLKRKEKEWKIMRGREKGRA